jgi:hypothetical protein
MGDIVHLDSKRPSVTYWVEFEVSSTHLSIELHDTEVSPEALLQVANNFIEAAQQLRREVAEHMRRELADMEDMDDDMDEYPPKKGWISRIYALFTG